MAKGETHQMILAELRSTGRLWALAFQQGLATALAGDTEADAQAEWEWSHFALSDHRSRMYIERRDDLPEAARATLLGGESRVQTHVDGAWTYGVLPDFEHEFDGRVTGAGRLYFAFDAKRLITARRHPQHVVDTVRRQAEKGALQIAEPIDGITALLTGFVDATEVHLVECAARLDHAEDTVLSDHGDLEELRLGPLRRELSGYHREFAALRSAFHRAGSHRNATRGGPLVERLQPLLLEIEDFDRDIAGLQDRAKLLHDEIDAKVSAAANRSLRVLTILSTLLLPPTLIVGAFGMNVRGIPFANDIGGFWAASALCAVVVFVCGWALWQARVLR